MPASEIPAQTGDGPQRTGGPGDSQWVILLAAVADLTFTGAVAVHVAFIDLSGWAAALVIGCALVFVAATIAALSARRSGVVLTAVVLIALTAGGAVVAAVDAGRRYDALRQATFGDRTGVRLVEPGSAQGRRMGGAMLSSISASLAAITAFPLAGYLLLRVVRTAGRTT